MDAVSGRVSYHHGHLFYYLVLAMTALERMRADPTCWDSRYDLPLCPLNNNPWIYMAYADLILGIQGFELSRVQVKIHYYSCEAYPSHMGLFWRWPDKSGGQNSHDEIMGAAYFHPYIASSILNYLDSTNGDFNVTGEKPSRWLQFNVYRLPWLKPYLLACAGRKVNLVRQAIFAAHITFSAFTNSGPDNAGGRLRNWLMLERMRDLPLVRAAARLWIKRVGAKDTLKGSLAIEPREVPILSELAPEGWVFP